MYTIKTDNKNLTKCHKDRIERFNSMPRQYRRSSIIVWLKTLKRKEIKKSLNNSKESNYSI
jgi:hypothetical protein